MLLNLTFLAERLHWFNALLAAFPNDIVREEQRIRLFPFSFSAILIGRPGRWRFRAFLLYFMVWMTVVLLPLVLVLYAQVRFLPYHHTVITWTHHIAVLVDLLLLWLLWLRMLMPGDGGASAAQIIPQWREAQCAARRTARTRRCLWGTGLLCVTVITGVFSLGIAVLPGEYMEGLVVF